jgi:hypothetical protein
MVSDNQTTVRISNFNCVNQDVKVFYTPKEGRNGLNDLLETKNKKSLTMTSDDWGGGFLNSDGSTWVSDGETLPYAFSSSIQIVFLCLPVGNITLSTLVGEPIDAFLLRLMETIVAALGTTNALFETSPMGAEIFYNSNGCIIRLIQYVPTGGAAQVIPLSWTITSIFPTANFVTVSVPQGFTLINPDGWMPYIEIKSLDVSDYLYSDGTDSKIVSGYMQFVESLLNQDLYIEELRRYSNNANQVNVPIEFKSFDSDGTQQATPQTTVIDPYQAQPALIDYSNIILDGQVYAEVGMLAGEFLELRIQYEAVGILNFEEIMQLDDILREQGVILNEKEITSQEKKDMQEAYSNFSGFNESEEKDKNKKSLIIAFAIGLIYLMK